MRPSYISAVGQWLHVNTITSTLAYSKSLRLYVFPSTGLGRVKSGALDPIFRTGGMSRCWARAGAAARAKAAARVAHKCLDISNCGNRTMIRFTNPYEFQPGTF